VDAGSEPAGQTAAGTLRGKLAAIGIIVAIVLVCGGGLTALTSDSVFRTLDTEDRGVELIRVPADAAPGEGPETAGYSVRVLHTGWFRTGDTCVAIASWRNASEGSRGFKYKTWQAYGNTLTCRWPRVAGGQGWLAARIAFPLPDDSGRHVFYAAVPDQAVRARISWPDGTTREVATRTVDGYDGRFVALWQPDFGLAGGGSRPEHTRITLYDAAGRPLDVH